MRIRILTLFLKILDTLESIGSEMRIKTSGGEEFVMKIWEAEKCFTEVAHLMTYYPNTRP